MIVRQPLSAAAGVRRGASGQDSMAALVAHVHQHPPNPALLAEVDAAPGAWA